MGWIEWFYFFVAIQIIHGLGTWKLYKKTGYSPLLSFIPIYSIIFFQEYLIEEFLVSVYFDNL